MKRQTILGVGIGMVLGAASCFALAFSAAQATSPTTPGAAAATGKAGCIDVSRVFDEYQRRKDFVEELNNVREALRAEDQKRQQELQVMASQIELVKPDDPTFAPRRRDLMERQIAYKTWAETKQADMEAQSADWTVRIYHEINAAIAVYAQQNGIDVMLFAEEFNPEGQNPQQIIQQISNRKVLHCAAGANHTAALIDKLNKDYAAAPKQSMLIGGN
jgi:Skp family chaperone for outer membrane proteins